MTTRSAAWLIPFALFAAGACSSDNTGLPPEISDAELAVRPISGTLLASPAGLDLGVALLKTSRVAAVEITNRGFTEVTLSPVTVSAPFGILDQNCGTELAAGASCFVLVTVLPTAFGPITGTLTLPSSANKVIVPLRVSGGFMVSARVNVDGAQITSDPAGLAPSPVVAGLFEGLFPGAVTLTAVPPPGGTFLGWDPACGDGGPTCVVPVPGRGAGDAVSINARFLPPRIGPTVTVDFTGGSTGQVFIVDETASMVLTSCITSPCVAAVPAGDQVSLSGYSSSQFGGWTGDCVATTHDCDLGAVTSDRAVTVAFNRDPQELVSFVSGDIPHWVAFAPDGGLYLSYLDVRKVRLDGTIEWRFPLVGVHDLASDAAGNVYGLTGVGEVFSLSPAGAMRWSKPINFAGNAQRSIESVVQVSSDGARVAVHTADGARVLDGDGNDRFAITGLTATDGFALAADGTLAIGVPAAAVNRRDVRRWTRDGTPLPTLASLAGNFDVSLAFDAGDAVCAVTVGAGVQTVSRTLPNASLAFRSPSLTGFSSLDPFAAIGVDVDGALAVARATDPTFNLSGVHLDAFSPTGAKIFTLEKKAVQQPFELDGVQIESFAVDPRSRRVAVVGRYAQVFGWIEVLALPAP